MIPFTGNDKNSQRHRDYPSRLKFVRAWREEQMGIGLLFGVMKMFWTTQKTNRFVHFKRMNFMVYEFYLNLQKEPML